MTGKILRGFFIFMRIAVCCCLIILIIAQTCSEASGETDQDSGEFNKLRNIDLRMLTLNLEDLPESELSPLLKEVGYKVKTKVTDFGDYKIETNVTGSDIAVIAIHGGAIERGTTELAYALASRNNYSYYSYLGVKLKDNSNLHIESAEFKEPAAMKIVSQSERTLSIHGCAGEEAFTYIGGRDAGLADKIRGSLSRYGFTVLPAPEGLAGVSPENIANKNKNGSGVQMELSQGLRAQFLSADGNLLESYVSAVSEAVNSSSAD